MAVMDLGPQLRASRELRGLTLDDVAARTKIPRQLLADLEKNDVSRWPKSRIYQVGFLRAYATTVGLDAVQLIEQFASALPEQPSRATVPKPLRGPSDPEPRRLVLGALTVAGCLFVTLLVYTPRRNWSSEATTFTPTFSFTATASQKAVRSVEPPANIVRELVNTSATSESAPLATARVPDRAEEAKADAEIDGELLIDSEPTGTWIVVNGIGRGKTPARIPYLPVGAYRIRLVRDGYESGEAVVTLTAGRPARSIKLTLLRK